MKCSQKILRIGDFEKLPFFESAILIFFSKNKKQKSISMKISQRFLDIKNVSKFGWLPCFLAKNHSPQTFQPAVYVLVVWVHIGMKSFLIKEHFFFTFKPIVFTSLFVKWNSSSVTPETCSCPFCTIISYVILEWCHEILGWKIIMIFLSFLWNLFWGKLRLRKGWVISLKKIPQQFVLLFNSAEKK